MDIIERQMKGAPLPNQVATKIVYEVRGTSGGLHSTHTSAVKAKATVRHFRKTFQLDFEVYRVTTITEKL